MLKHQTFVHLGAATAVTLLVALPVALAVVLGAVWRSINVSFGAADPLNLVIGALPTSAYIVAPMAGVLVVCRNFHSNSQNFALPAMFAAGMSIWRCAAPALILGTVFTIGACILAWVLAPMGVTMVENAKFDLRRNIDVESLRAGQFHTFSKGDLTISLSFKRNLGGSRIQGVIVAIRRQKEAGSIIVSEFAHFRKTKQSLILTMTKGNRVSDTQSTDKNPVYFRTYTIVLPLKAGQDGYVRKYVTKQEMSFSQLMAHAGFDNPHQTSAGIARSELVKRFLVPMVNISHIVLALGLLYLIGPIRLRMNRGDIWIAIGFVCVHAVLIALIEIATRHSIVAMVILGLLIALEALVGAWLLYRGGKTLRRMELPARMGRHIHSKPERS